MAKICYIYREKEKNETSIELVFDTVTAEIEKRDIGIRKWYKPVSWKQTFRQIWNLRKEKFDLYHITGDVNYLWLFFPWRKTTMTIHDIGMYKNNPKTLKRRLFVFFSFILPSFFLKKLTCVSELTKQDLVNMLGIDSKRLIVISNPVVFDIEPSEKKFDETCPVILQIGTGVHKNLDSLIEAVNGLDCKIDIVGNPDNLLIKRMENLNINYTVATRLSNEEMLEKYRQCDILFFVSRSEGFGLPILEAQAMRRPVLTADTEPTKSVCGGGALLCSPEDIPAIRAGILTLCSNPTERERIISIGAQNVKRYDKVNIAKEYLDFYNNYFGV